MTGQLADNIAKVHELCAEGLTKVEIAGKLGICPEYVMVLARRAGVKPASGFAWKLDVIKRLAGDGKTRPEISAETGIPLITVGNLIRRHRIPTIHARTIVNPGEREQRMASLYKNGKTLNEIGQEYGLTRERVRQLLTKFFGMTAEDGGQHFRAEERQRRFEANRNEKALKNWGCDWDQYVTLRDMKKPTRAFGLQKRNAASRGIAWELTLWQWWQIWQQSGHWPDRGRGSGGYQMCRKGDQGPYAVDNVYIAPGITNIQDYWHDVKSGARTRRKSPRQATTTPEHTKAVLKAAADRYRQTPKFKLRLKLRRLGLSKEARDAIVAASFPSTSTEEAA